MRQSPAVTLLVCLTLAACNSTPTTPEPREESRGNISSSQVSAPTSSAPAAAFSFTDEAGWEKTDFIGLSVAYLAPVQGEKDTFRENVNLVIETGVPGLTSKQYAEATLPLMEQLMTNFKALKSGEMTIDGQTVVTRDFTFSQGTLQLKDRQAYLVVDDTAYVLTYSAEPAQFDAFLSDAMRIMSSLKVTKE